MKMPEAKAMSPFEREGMTPSYAAVGKVVYIQAARAVVAYLADQGALGDMDWESMPVLMREAWIEALGKRHSEAHRAATKEAMAELTAYEALALMLWCRACGAEEDEPCRDKRRNHLVHIKHPHQERLDDLAREGLWP